MEAHRPGVPLKFSDKELQLIVSDGDYPLKSHKAKALAAECLRLRGLIASAERNGGNDTAIGSPGFCPWCHAETSTWVEPHDVMSGRYLDGPHYVDCEAFSSMGVVK